MEGNQELYGDEPAAVRGKRAHRARPPKHAHSWTPWGLPCVADDAAAAMFGTRRGDWARHCRVCGKAERGFWLGTSAPEGLAACLEHQWEPDTWAMDRGKWGGLTVERRLRCVACGEVDRDSVVRERG